MMARKRVKTAYTVVLHDNEYGTGDGWVVSVHTKKDEAYQRCQLLDAVNKAAVAWHDTILHGPGATYHSDLKAMEVALKGACGYRYGLEERAYFSVETAPMPEHPFLVVGHPAWPDILETIPALFEVFTHAVAKEAAQMALKPTPPAPKRKP